ERRAAPRAAGAGRLARAGGSGGLRRGRARAARGGHAPEPAGAAAAGAGGRSGAVAARDVARPHLASRSAGGRAHRLDQAPHPDAADPLALRVQPRELRAAAGDQPDPLRLRPGTGRPERDPAARPRTPVKLACVVHRYGPDIAGGSEAHCRGIAERLAATHDVTVLTSCARDYLTWADSYPEGRSELNGVTVLRFPVERTRSLHAFTDLSHEVFDRPAARERQEAWFRENGPCVPRLLDHLRAHGRDYDLVLFWSYRYYTARLCRPIVAGRAVLVPTAQEDQAILLDALEPFFRLPAGFLFLTPEEQEIVVRRAGRPLEPSAIAGMGLDPAP